MQVEEFLSLLKGVKQTGPDRWISRCPHHNDKTPSLAITRGDRVPILLHCFAGCDAAEIVGSVGLELHDLMPEPEPDWSDERSYRQNRESRLPFTADQALQCLDVEATFLFIVACDVVDGKPLDSLTKDRLITAASRINQARRLCDV